ncbi:hypothetical protein P691DRAFT_767256 [Macrolepiota fuliginosa MF-IS2]|uniref:Uncharacterized protein n=1 Tax=Macrolepiota fuliginosa MF-IS2 TaxID=1400762 RepID=A0A9P6BVG9_9AGAR|nr:hypothetical protein P691DRAFT_767256 [Macrolepiota fuliginosa MF-IS2]
MDRQWRQNKERNPLTTTAHVYVWDWDFDNPTKFTQTQVQKDKQKDTLLEYSDVQKWYDSYYNEWDCCLEWGQDREDIPMDNSLNTPSPPPTAPSPIVLLALAMPDSVTSSTILVPSSAALLNMPTVAGGEAESGLILAPTPVEKDQDITGE